MPVFASVKWSDGRHYIKVFMRTFLLAMVVLMPFL